jgi:hypothetical protein
MDLVRDRLFGESGQAGLGPPIRFRFTIDKKRDDHVPATQTRWLGPNP